jgi:hypothetical protein
MAAYLSCGHFFDPAECGSALHLQITLAAVIFSILQNAIALS